MRIKVTPVFTDKRVFQLEYVPERILHRDEQISRIRSILADLERGVRPRNMLCVGDFGSGKTAVVRSICRNLPVGVISSYVNCSEQNTENRVIRSVLRDLGVSVKLGFPSDHYLQLFKDSVARTSSLILVLDEVDKLVERKNSDYEELFYTLSRSVSNVVVVLLTNESASRPRFSQALTHESETPSDLQELNLMIMTLQN
ncbi:MAG: AAA family ATPase [Candidatus Bathyarchaeia archaeon]